jgi:hypothetical protein
MSDDEDEKKKSKKKTKKKVTKSSKKKDAGDDSDKEEAKGVSAFLMKTFQVCRVFFASSFAAFSIRALSSSSS